MGWGKAARLIYTGVTISGREAERCGLLENVVSEEQLDEAVDTRHVD